MRGIGVLHRSAEWLFEMGLPTELQFEYVYAIYFGIEVPKLCPSRRSKMGRNGKCNLCISGYPHLC
jgi:hypothetical protein